MELDDLKMTWATLDARVEKMESASMRDQGKKEAGRLRNGPISELVAGGLTVLWMGGFLADNWTKVLETPFGALPSLSLFVLGVFTIWLSVRQLAMISTLDYSGAVVEAQQQIGALKTLRVRSTQFVMLTGLPLWVIFPLVAGQTLIDYNFIYAVNGTWVGANLVFGVILAGGLVLLARKLGQRPGFWQKLNDTLAGTEIQRAERMLVEVERFKGA
jgi:hypothetical protein